MKKIRNVTIFFLATLVIVGGVFYASKTNNTLPVSSPLPRGEDAHDTKGWQVYKNAEYGFQFRYPVDWGEVIIKWPTLNPFDTGVRRIVSFERQPDFFISVFSEDFSQDVGEGSPFYFKPDVKFQESDEQLIHLLETDKVHGTLDIHFFERIHIAGKDGIRVVGNRGYVLNQVGVSYLLPKYFYSNRAYNVMGILHFGDKKDWYSSEDMSAIVEDPVNKTAISNFEKILKTLQPISV